MAGADGSMLQDSAVSTEVEAVVGGGGMAVSEVANAVVEVCDTTDTVVEISEVADALVGIALQDNAVSTEVIGGGRTHEDDGGGSETAD